MDEVAKLTAAELADVFRVTAQHKGITVAIAEKDFWVCWVLKRLFSLPAPPAGMLFKGGTSLSKVYGVIDRFSEDVDLSFDRTGLGFGGANDPATAPSKKKQQAAVEQLAAACRTAVHAKLLPMLDAKFQEALDTPSGESTWSIATATDDPDGATLLFRYPTVAPRKDAPLYIRPMVRLEFGARSDHWPSQPGTVQPYAAEAVPKVFKDPTCQIKTLAAERTFWEKVTLLHKWHHAPPDRKFPDRQSRHYYDVVRLADHDIARRALPDLDLLAKVVAHKQLYFQQGWARYELAVPGTLRVVPPAERLPELKADYAKMQEMLFGAVPPFEQILQRLGVLESQINKSASIADEPPPMKPACGN